MNTWTDDDLPAMLLQPLAFIASTILRRSNILVQPLHIKEINNEKLDQTPFLDNVVNIVAS